MIIDTHDATQMCNAQDDNGVIYELCPNGEWLAYDASGAIAHAPTWREIYEKTGHWWM